MKMKKHDLDEYVAKANADTTARVAAVLAQLSAKNYIVLAVAQSDSGGKDYEIRMGDNNSVYCTCKGWQYDKTGTGCKHIRRFKKQIVRRAERRGSPMVLKRSK